MDTCSGLCAPWHSCTRPPRGCAWSRSMPSARLFWGNLSVPLDLLASVSYIPWAGFEERMGCGRGNGHTMHGNGSVRQAHAKAVFNKVAVRSSCPPRMIWPNMWQMKSTNMLPCRGLPSSPYCPSGCRVRLTGTGYRILRYSLHLLGAPCGLRRRGQRGSGSSLSE